MIRARGNEDLAGHAMVENRRFGIAKKVAKQLGLYFGEGMGPSSAFYQPLRDVRVLRPVVLLTGIVVCVRVPVQD